MTKQIHYTLNQREKGLIILIRDAKNLHFNKDLIINYLTQLKDVQSEMKRLKDKMIMFNKQIESQDAQELNKHFGVIE